MKRALVLAAVLASPSAAHAGRTCGGGGGDGGGMSDHRGSSSSSSSSSSSNDTSWSYRGPSERESPAAETATGCIDDTDVLGYRHCTKFGTWSNNLRVPRMFVELGTHVRQFGTSLASHGGNVAHGAETFAYRMVMPEGGAGTDTAMTSVLRFSFGLPHGLYTGLEGELGGIVAPRGASFDMMSTGTFGSPDIDPKTGMYIGALGTGGVRATTHRGVVALEGAAGVRSVRYRFDSRYHNCEETSTIDLTRGVVEARARAELFLGPWLTAGATLGTSLVDRNDWLAGIYFGVHSRAFGGGR